MLVRLGTFNSNDQVVRKEIKEIEIHVASQTFKKSEGIHEETNRTERILIPTI